MTAPFDFDYVMSFFIAWKSSFFSAISLYLEFAGAFIFVMAVFWKTGFGRRKIQQRWPTVADVRRDILNSFNTTIVFGGLGVITPYLLSLIRTRLSPLPPSNAGYFVGTLMLTIVMHDAYFYWTHRLMHHPRLFRYFHQTHHKSITPTPFTAYSISVLEAIVQFAFPFMWFLICPLHPMVALIFGLWALGLDIISHSGVEWMPYGLAENRWFWWMSTITHHDLHHTNGRYNYGLCFTWWDRLMGTQNPDEFKILREKKAALQALKSTTDVQTKSLPACSKKGNPTS